MSTHQELRHPILKSAQLPTISSFTACCERTTFLLVSSGPNKCTLKTAPPAILCGSAAPAAALAPRCAQAHRQAARCVLLRCWWWPWRRPPRCAAPPPPALRLPAAPRPPPPQLPERLQSPRAKPDCWASRKWDVQAGQLHSILVELFWLPAAKTGCRSQCSYTAR